ncbi:MAG TPA: hypothetical protein VLS44_09425 [Nitrospira sp.]|nr:hypothetical protein [Nitrospira sp.]
MTPSELSQSVERYFAERHAHLASSGDRTQDGRQFTWCGEVFDYLTEGLTERLAAIGITFSQTFPGPFRLLDEEQRADGQHIRRFWTTALQRGCPVAKLCTSFVHRHDQVTLPELPHVQAYPPDHPTLDTEEPA